MCTNRIKLSYLLISAVSTVILLSALYFAVGKFFPQVSAVAENIIVKTFSFARVKEYTPSSCVNITLDDIEHNNNLILVSNEHPLSDKFTANTAEFRETGLFVDENMAEPLEQLISAVKSGTDDRLFLMSTYRTSAEQEKLYEEDSAVANKPYASEHQTGLAADVYVRYFAGKGFLKSKAGRYVNLNCYKYGFIIRYDFGKTDSTKMQFEPWHIRYVGAPHAEIMYKNNLSLEEYIESFEPDKFYCFNGYILARLSEDNGCIAVPSNVRDASVCADNTGYWFLTARLT